ncbi:MAG TPA: UDP-glucose 4-epimerase GalE [Acidobacteriaceae bacterium]|nr:UDP-glucose 4-epimerase GalE [Acidobacteriaceae bacterium]
MKTLVTGGAGYIGGTVVRQLLQAGHHVTVYDNLGHGKRENVPAGVPLLVGDVSDSARLNELFSKEKFDAVLHFAALIEAGESVLHPEKFFSNNTAATLTLLNAMAAHKIPRFVFSSTAAVYGNPDATPIPETAKLAPVNPYGESKLRVEQALPDFREQYGLRYAVLRYFNVAGALLLENGKADYGEQHEPESHLIPILLDVALGLRSSIKIYGTGYPTSDGTCIRDYIHVADIGRAHLLALAALDTKDTLLYNLGNGRGFSVREVIEAVRRVTGHPIPAIEEPRRPGDPAILVADATKIAAELGWQPQAAKLDEIIASAWIWHQHRFGK